MVLGSRDANSVVLVAEKLLMVQEADLNLFIITEHRLVDMSHPKKGVKMEVELKRKLMSEMMTTYFPSLLLMLITFATTFFKPFFFEAALSVNLTTMLVMTTIFISKMEGLPPTSATKMIDYWLILCQLVPFAQVVLLTAIEFLREEELEEKQDPEKEEQTNDKIEDEAKPKEAWTIVKVKRSNVSFVPVLAVIGRFFLCGKLGLFNKYRFFFREEGDAYDCALCLLPLLWNRCNFLF